MRLSKSVLGEEEVLAVKKVILENGYLGMGSEVQKFEGDIADYLGIKSKNVTCVSSGTAALHLALEAVLKPGDEVLVPSLTYLSSYQSISAAGCIPVSCEVYEDTLTIDIEDANNKITKNTRAIMPVHYASNLVDLEKIFDLAKFNNLRIIEDAAHAFGCKYKGKKIGSFGDIVCFSFDGIKNITSGEGGAIISFDSKVNSKVKDGRLLSIENDTEKRFTGNRSWEFDVIRQGYRYHMSNIFAAIGREQLKKLESDFAPKRITLFDNYVKNLQDIPQIKLQKINSFSKIIPHIFPLRIINNRDGLKTYLEKNNIPTGIHYKPNHLLTFYRKNKVKLKVTEMIYDQTLTLPLHPELTINDVKKITQLIKNYFK